MARYWVAIGLVALAVGGLFRAAAQTHRPLLEMAGTIGVLLLGVLGTVAIAQQQIRSGRERLEEALQSLGEGVILTDWADGRGPAQAPDYLLVAPGGVVAVVADAMPNTVRGRKAAARMARVRERAQAAAAWVAAQAGELLPPGVAVQPLVVLTRRQVQPEDAGDPPVVNPEDLASHLAGLQFPGPLDREACIRITRHLRRQAEAALAARR